jgi:Glycosyl hydrolases family 16
MGDPTRSEFITLVAAFLTEGSQHLGRRDPQSEPRLVADGGRADISAGGSGSSRPSNFNRLLLETNFQAPVSWRSGGPTDPGFRAGKGAVTPLYFYQQWGQGRIGAEVPGSDAFIMNSASDAVKNLQLELVQTGQDGLRLDTVRTPQSVKDLGITAPWITPLLTWQHSFGVKPPFYAECEAKFPAVPGMWPAFWLVGSSRFAQKDHDAGPYVEIDVAEFYGKYPANLIQAIHWSNADNSLSMEFDPASFRNRLSDTDFTKEFHHFAVAVAADGQMRFFIDGRPSWSAKFPSKVEFAQYYYPILSAGTGNKTSDAGVPGPEAPDRISTFYKSVRIWGEDLTEVQRG